jgi:YgiT-type zinc finger domain-containing protein
MGGKFYKEDKRMKCIHCQGEMKRGTAPFHIERENIHISLDKIPAWVCSQCGEVYFEEKEIEILEQLIQSIEAQNKKLTMTA